MLLEGGGCRGAAAQPAGLPMEPREGQPGAERDAASGQAQGAHSFDMPAEEGQAPPGQSDLPKSQLSVDPAVYAYQLHDGTAPLQETVASTGGAANGRQSGRVAQGGVAGNSPARQKPDIGQAGEGPGGAHMRSPRAAAQKHASTTARPGGSTAQGMPRLGVPSRPGQEERQQAPLTNFPMQPPKSPLKGSVRQTAGNTAAQTIWAPPKVAGQQHPGPTGRNDYYSMPSNAQQAAAGHPPPRFLGGGSLQASGPARPALGAGEHPMRQDGSAGKQQAGAARQGHPSQPGVFLRVSPAAAPSHHMSRTHGAPSPSSQLPSPRLIVRSMDPEHAQALSPPLRNGPDAAVRKPARHLDFGGHQFGLEQSERLGGSPPQRFFTQAPPLLQAGSPVRPIPGASPYRGLRPPEKQETPTKKKQCNCKNSRCLKLYCECFASGNYCIDCNCHNCCNNAENEAVRQEAVEATLERNPNAFRPKIAPSPDPQAGPAAGAELGYPTDTEATEQPVAGKHHKGCHCKKSGCLKKYCECFQANVLCTDACKCNDCKNYDGSDERRLLFQGAVDTAHPPPFAPAYLAASPPPYKRPRLQDRPVPSPPQAKPGQVVLGRPGLPAGAYLPARVPQKPLTKSLLSHVVKQDAVQELCKLLAIVTQEVAKNFEAQHPGLLAAQHQRQEAAFAAAASAASVRAEVGVREQGVDGQAMATEGSGGEGSPAVAEEEQSPEAMLLSCDEELPAEKEVQTTLPGSQYGANEDGGGESAAAQLYALQEQTVLEEFASCLQKIISVGQKRMRQYEESLSPPRPAYTGPPPLHYRPPPPQLAGSPQQRLVVGQAVPLRQPGGAAVRYVPQYQQQAGTGPAYRPQYQQQQAQHRQPAQAGRQPTYRPLQPPAPTWLAAPPALGQPMVRAPYGMAVGQQQLAPQRHPAMRPGRQQSQRNMHQQAYVQHLRPVGPPPTSFHYPAQRGVQYMHGPQASHHTLPVRPGGPAVSGKGAPPAPPAPPAGGDPLTAPARQH